MNIVAIIGNVASEPELRHTSQGRAVCSFRVAVSRPGDGSTADFFDIVSWERQAEVCQQFLTIGRRVSVEGRMHCRVLDGEPQRTSVEIVASRIELLSSNRSPVVEREAEDVEVVR